MPLSDAEIIEVEKRLVENKFRFFREIIPKYEPHNGKGKGGQIAIHQAFDQNRYTFVVAGYQSGKSTVAINELSFQAYKFYVLGKVFKAWIVAPRHKLTEKVFNGVRDALTSGNIDLERQGIISSIKEKDGGLEIEFGNGGFIRGVSSDSLTSLLGEDLDLIVWDEACASNNPKKVFQYLQPRLMARGGKLLVTTTPNAEDYIYKLWDAADKKERKGWAAFRFKSEDNPKVLPEYLEEARQTNSLEAYMQFYEASFIQKEGKFFSEFGPDNYKSWEYNPNLECDLSIDFGFNRPWIIWFQVEGDNVYIFDEFCTPNSPVDTLINVIKSKLYAVQDRYCDPAGTHMNDQTGMSDVTKFEDAGLPLKYTWDSILRDPKEGAKIMRGKIKNVYGKRTLFIDPDKCPQTAKALLSIETNVKTQKYMKDEEFEDAIDCIRYFTINRFAPTKDEFFMFNWN